jgi:hypothetical protein
LPDRFSQRPTRVCSTANTTRGFCIWGAHAPRVLFAAPRRKLVRPVAQSSGFPSPGVARSVRRGAERCTRGACAPRKQRRGRAPTEGTRPHVWSRGPPNEYSSRMRRPPQPVHDRDPQPFFGQ